jgi:hypothetical protein
MRKSKFVGMRDGLWECVRCAVSTVQGARCKLKLTADGKKAKAKSPGSKQYEYDWRRPTSDGKAFKYITLNAQQSARVLKGLSTVEEYAQKKEAKRSFKHFEKIDYCFCD